MIPPREAWDRLLPHLDPLGAEELDRRAARGRVLAAPLAATVDVPAADVSAMDGYALGGAAAVGERRPVAGLVAAGHPPGFVLPAGAAVRIMTGAPVPAAADRVIAVEDTDRGEREVELRIAPEPGAHIRRRGEILARGDRLLPAGAVLTPGALSLLATHGHRRVSVHRAPRVAIVTTGDEVVPPDAEPAPGQLRDSHTDFLLAAGAALGLAPVHLGIAPDRADAIAALVERGLAADVLLLCGGVSAGEFDFVEEVLAGFGCHPLFDAVAIQPGKPVVAAVHPGGLVFGLPGNPASVMVTFWLLVRPALRRLLGHPDGYLEGAFTGELAAPAPGAKGRDRFLPAEVVWEDGRAMVTPIASKGSHDLAAYGRGNALLHIAAGSPPAAAGERCLALPIG